LPDFPWDLLAPYAERARAHPGGVVDLSVGTPVDPTPDVVRAALAAATDAPGYPTAAGSAELRAAIVRYLADRWGARGLTEGAVVPTVGSKELVALLPTLLAERLAPEGLVGVPELAYPTYEVGARLAGRGCVRYAEAADLPSDEVALIWVNSPGNPSGRVLSAAELADLVDWARRHRAVVASDECYLEFGWETEPVSVLHPEVCGGSHVGVLAVHSLSKRSNMAGYRAGFVAGDRDLVRRLYEVRRHAGLLLAAPVQAAMRAALDDGRHVVEQRARYERRRGALRSALHAAGLRVEGPAGGLYLWATRDEPGWETVAWLAELGVLVAPGVFYGDAGGRHVRVALTATDERVAAAAERLGVAPVG
jgi:succinyldiaminopimelate transaminase